MSQAFPLSWPPGRPRRTSRRTATFGTTKRGSFKSRLTVAEAMQRLQSELDLLGARYPIVSSNLEPRLDGLPRSGQREPTDPGIALYFQLNGKPHCMPCDTYDRAADNIAAIAGHIEATRKIERHGVATVAEMFSGFAALPPPDARRPWRDVLELANVPGSHITRETIMAAYRRLARSKHPDAGGSETAMSELNVARDEALKGNGNG
ncbi:J domain-containing protein [Ancylobacter sp. MQZ15Z-1]|uniref:J domain-containing protein n=1 Tax=Ancylobacter mangrovi TaxID=2972472 RepID=A0A9X2PIV6_9HYPH|nr:J domain-containing protein [Ancylobacter mangrovi]MCS0497911.1 J domain-containing protein [Ancylobacter mangrovi]